MLTINQTVFSRALSAIKAGEAGFARIGIPSPDNAIGHDTRHGYRFTIMDTEGRLSLSAVSESTALARRVMAAAVLPALERLQREISVMRMKPITVEPIALAASDDQWSDLDGGDHEGGAWTAGVHLASGAMGKDDAAEHLPIGSTLVLTNVPGGDRMYDIADHYPHAHGNWTTPVLDQQSGESLTGDGSETHCGHLCKAVQHGRDMGYPSLLMVGRPAYEPIGLSADESLALSQGSLFGGPSGIGGQSHLFSAETGHWVTMSGQHVFISGGVVTKGPSNLVGMHHSQAGLKAKIGPNEESYFKATAPTLTVAPKESTGTAIEEAGKAARAAAYKKNPPANETVRTPKQLTPGLPNYDPAMASMAATFGDDYKPGEHYAAGTEIGNHPMATPVVPRHEMTTAERQADDAAKQAESERTFAALSKSRRDRQRAEGDPHAKNEALDERQDILNQANEMYQAHNGDIQEVTNNSDLQQRFNDVQKHLKALGHDTRDVPSLRDHLIQSQERDNARVRAESRRGTTVDTPAEGIDKAITGPAAPVDTSRQLGMFAKNADGSAAEVGERAGQATMFGNTPVIKPASVAGKEIVGSKSASDPKHTAEMFPAEGKTPMYLEDLSQQQRASLGENSELHMPSRERGDLPKIWQKTQAEHLSTIKGNKMADGTRMTDEQIAAERKNAYAKINQRVSKSARKDAKAVVDERLEPRERESESKTRAAHVHEQNVRMAHGMGLPVPPKVAKEYGLSPLSLASDDASGHWVTIEHEHVFIHGAAGFVPERLHAGNATRFSKAHIERKLIEHHEQVQGKGTYTADDEKWLEGHGGAGSAFTFYKHLPTEIKQFQQGRPELRKLFKVTNDVKAAHGADAYAADSDRYESIAEAKAGSPLKAAKATARQSQDPGMKFLADVHDNLPDDAAALKGQATRARKAGKHERAARLESLAAETTPLENINAGGLRVGDKFKVNGVEHRVAQDSEGYRVLKRGKDYQVPVEALPTHVPHDKGSFRAGKGHTVATKAERDAIPFSADEPVTLDASERAGLLPAEVMADEIDPEGRPVRYYKKEIARVGHWHHRGQRHALTGAPMEFDITHEDCEDVVNNFKGRLEAGIKPFIPDSHMEKLDAKKNNGSIEDVWHEGPHLYGKMRIVGKSSIDAVGKNDVSVYLVNGNDSLVIDATGKRYKGRVLHHVALTPDPALPHLAPFQRIAASADSPARNALVFQLASANSIGADSLQEYPMDPVLLGQLRERFGIGSDVANSELPDLIGQRALSLSAELTAEKTKAVALSADLATKTIALSANDVSKLDPMSLSLISRAMRNEREQTIASGVISEAGMKEIDGLMLSDGKPTSTALALSAGSTDPLYMRLCEIIRRNPGIKTGNAIPAGATPADPKLALSGDTEEQSIGKMAIAAANATIKSHYPSATVGSSK